MSHYPSTQELAAFRRSIEPAMRHTESGPVGAYPHELHDGIGYRDDDWLGGSAAPVGFRYTFARREASALRSRAHAHGFGSLADVETFAPSPWPDLDCPACHDPFSNPNCDGIVASDTWAEDEPRHPLPIRYQPSFTIG